MQAQSVNRVFALRSSEDGQTALRAVADRFATKKEALAKREETLIDTVDWRVHRAGGVLAVVRSGQGIVLVWRDAGGATRFRMPLPEAPEFAGELPDGAFREALLPICGIRRLLPAVRVALRRHTLCVLDEREKTVARVSIEQGTVKAPGTRGGGRRLPSVVTLVGVRGYDDATDRVAELLAGLAELEPAPASDLRRALAELGEEPNAHRSVGVTLDPELPAGTAMAQVLRPLFEAMRRNEDGMRSDLDTEFLHEFRVALRRTRSALGQLKQLFDPGRLKPFRRDFSWLGGVTGPARDLDVYLLSLPRYRAALPDECRADLDPLELHLRRRREEAQAELLAALDSRRYRRLVVAWDTFLDAPLTDSGPEDARRPIVEIASRRIERAYRRVLRHGERLGPESDAERFHDLRIDAKKLRYLLEIFARLYDARGVTRAIKSLKKLQDCLGDMNDLVVQKASLRTFATEMQEDHTADERTFDAVGRIVAEMEDLHDRERRRFVTRFRRFADPENRKRLKRMLKSGAGASS